MKNVFLCFEYRKGENSNSGNGIFSVESLTAKEVKEIHKNIAKELGIDFNNVVIKSLTVLDD